MKSHLLMLSRYHLWAFEMLYGALLPLSDTQYRADCGLFFESIHGTLNHLLLADCVWFGRCVDVAYAVDALDQELIEDRAALERALYEHSARWTPWLEALDDAALGEIHRYHNLGGSEFSNPLAATLLHVFNHGSHHRGQISAAISGYGHPAPEMDLIGYIRGLGTALPTA